MGIIYALLILTALIMVHELGHFIAAKIFGVQILEFAIGMGPKIFSVKRKGIDYRINIFPIGGYVRLAGEDVSGIEDTSVEKDKLLYEKPAWQRLMISLAGPLASILTGYFIMILTFGIWGVYPVKVERVVENSPAQRAEIEKGDIIYSVNGKRVFDSNEFSKAVNTYDVLEIEVLRNSRKLLISVSPEQTPDEVEIVLDVEALSGEIQGKVKTINNVKPSVELFKQLPDLKGQYVKLELLNGTVEGKLLSAIYIPPRKTVGIYFSSISPIVQKGFGEFKTGDVILSVNGYKINDGVDFSRILGLLDSNSKKPLLIHISGDEVFYHIHSEFGELVNVVVERDGNLINLSFKRDELLDIFENKIMFKSPVKAMREGIFEVIRDGIIRTNRIIVQMGEILAMLFTGRLGLNSLSGPIGVVAFVGNVSKLGFEPILFLTVIITLNLGMINLIPLPALDGGRIVFALLEMITRKKLDPSIESYIHFVGFMLLMALMVYITYVDIVRLIG
ncbi:MAG: regulator of sigma protease [Thermotogaceae bacterium]|jgi:regulator of sigma E protease|nr:regulator of sigma protease [Thermotogaceae bacterium]MDN5337453.1 regulator of sigma protease [Thermotogaceae bacterium]